VVPEGTATLERTIVEQDFCDLLAEAAPDDPENVQEVARFARLGAAVIAGWGGDEAKAQAAKLARTVDPKSLWICMVIPSYLIDPTRVRV
jgi:hypothetical protein